MPRKREPMRKVKDILRLKFEAGLSHERIATALGLSKGAVTQYLQRAARAGVSWPVAPALDDTALEALLFPPTPRLRSSYASPDFPVIHQELNRKGVTLQLLWDEYVVAHPGAAYGYSQFCAHYHCFRDSLKRLNTNGHLKAPPIVSTTAPWVCAPLGVPSSPQPPPGSNTIYSLSQFPHGTTRGSPTGTITAGRSEVLPWIFLPTNFIPHGLCMCFQAHPKFKGHRRWKCNSKIAAR